MADIPAWWMKGDWFDVCSCDLPCPCEFGQNPTNGHCEGVLTHHIRKGVYGDVRLDGAEIPGKVVAAADALTGPTTPPGARVQLLNPPGSETGPGQTATWGTAREFLVDGHGFQWSWVGKSSKHIPFDYAGPS